MYFTNVKVEPLSQSIGLRQCTNMFRLVVTCKSAADGLQKNYVGEWRASYLCDINNGTLTISDDKLCFLGPEAIDCNSG